VTPPESLAALVQDRRDALIGLLQGLIRSSREGETATQTFVAERLERLGCRVDAFRYRPHDLDPSYEAVFHETADPNEHLCVVGELAGADDARSLLLFAHPDGEPVAGTEGWQHDPFAGEIDGGRLYGWGVADDLVGVASMIGSVELLHHADLLPRGRILLISAPSKRRAQGIVAALERGYRTDAALYWHPAESGVGLEEIKGVTLGLLKFTLDVEGRPPDTREPTHTPFAHLGVDPIEKAWSLHRALRALSDRRAAEVRYPILEERVGRSTHLHLASVHGGDERAPTRMAARCRLTGSITFPPGEAMAQVQQQVVAAIDEVAQSDPWLREHPPVLRWTMGTEGSSIDLDHPLYRTVHDEVAAVTERAPFLNPLHAGSDIRNPKLHSGIPTVGLGSLAGNLSQTGHVDEWVDVEDYLRAVHAGSRIALAWCNGASDRADA
jgi:acetylornithine deacetylase